MADGGGVVGLSRRYVTNSYIAHLKRQRGPQLHEEVVKLCCGKCRRELADAIGDGATGLRHIRGSEISATKEPGGRWRTDRHGPHPHTTFVRGAGTSARPPHTKPTGEQFLAELEDRNRRHKFGKHGKKCRGDIPILRDKLDAAFRRALTEGRTSLYLPDDLRGL